MFGFIKLLTELQSDYGAGITFVDIDETTFHTKAKIDVVDDDTGKIVKKLNNQEYNTFKLKKGYRYGYSEFRDAKLFKNTAIPIMPVIKRVKQMFKRIGNGDSKIVFLTARAEFDNPDIFISTFRQYGIPIDKIDVQLAGNLATGTVASAKKKIITQYLTTGLYRRVRMLDDDMGNINMFIDYSNNVSKAIVNKVKKRYKIAGDEKIPPIQFFALLVNQNGSLKRIQ